MNRKSVRKPKLIRQFDAATSPIAVVSDGFEVLYLNAAGCQWFGITNDEAVGYQLKYSSTAVENSLPSKLAGLCPDPSLLEDGTRHAESGFVYAHRDSTPIWRKASFTLIPGSSGAGPSILIVTCGPDLMTLPEISDPSNELRSGLHHLLAGFHAIDAKKFRLSSLVGTGSQAKRIRRQVEAAAGNQSDCLIVGPPGSGREHLARTIFHEKQLENSCLVPIHCAIADSQLIQSGIRNWVFDQRERRTRDWMLLLDVDCLQPEGQLELLGYTQLPNFGMRIIATARNELLQLAKSGEFSLELAMYLDVQTIRLVPLTERASDIPLLAQQFIESRNTRSEKQISRVSDELAELLCEHSWPHNVDELKQVIDSAYDHCAGSTIQPDDLPDAFHHGLSAARIGYRQVTEIDLDDYLAEIEKELMARALAQSQNNRTQAAKLLGISRARLLRRGAALGLIESRKEVDTDEMIDASAFKEAE